MLFKYSFEFLRTWFFKQISKDSIKCRHQFEIGVSSCGNWGGLLGCPVPLSPCDEGLGSQHGAWVNWWVSGWECHQVPSFGALSTSMGQGWWPCNPLELPCGLSLSWAWCRLLRAWTSVPAASLPGLSLLSAFTSSQVLEISKQWVICSSCVLFCFENMAYCPSVQFSRLVVSDSLWSHGLQHARLPCPSPTPEACSHSCPSSWWCHPTISSSVVLFSSCLQRPWG